MKHVLLLSLDPSMHALARSVLGAANANLSVATSLSQLIGQLNMPANETCLIVLGLDALIPSQRSAARAVVKIREKLPSATIVFHAERKHLIDAHDHAWAKMCGADNIVANITATRWSRTGDQLMKFLEADELLLSRLRQRIMPYVRAAQKLESNDQATRIVAAGEALGFDLADVARRMGRSGGVDIRDRSYHLRSFADCFVASDAVAWIAKALKISRSDAVLAG
ncbi:MAG: DEP domain-containing protein, partial [Casimicrobium sp.]